MTEARLVVVGGGPAAHAAAGGAREAGWRDEILVLAGEPEPPYDRTLLSKRYLLEDQPRARLALPPADATVRLDATVQSLDPVAHQIRIVGGERIGYDRVLLATGARPRVLPGYADSLYLRQVPDADRLRALLARGHPLEIVGAGFVGCEVAVAGRARGLPVTVHEALAQPLLRVLGPRLGALVAELHRAHGVDLRTGADHLPEPRPDLVVATGSLPNQELAEAAGIHCESGVVVDELGRTSAEDVYAAGDCARFWSPALGSRIRVEHFQTAQRHGRSVGHNLAAPADPQPFTEWPWFWTDQYEEQLQYLGAGLPWDDLRFRGDPGVPPFAALQIRQGCVVGVLCWNDGRTMTRIRRILERRIAATPDRLCDPATDLSALARR